MMNDVKALCDARAVPNLVSFCGAYHVPDGGQVRGQVGGHRDGVPPLHSDSGRVACSGAGRGHSGDGQGIS